MVTRVAVRGLDSKRQPPVKKQEAMARYTHVSALDLVTESIYAMLRLCAGRLRSWLDGTIVPRGRSIMTRRLYASVALQGPAKRSWMPGCMQVSNIESVNVN